MSTLAGGIMSVAAALQSLSVESATLLLGSLMLLIVVVGLHVRNIRWVQRLANSDASREAKARIEKLIDAVEKLSAASQKAVATNPRPLSKGRRYVSAARSRKASPQVRRVR